MMSFPRSFAIGLLILVPLATSGFAATFLAEGYSVRIWQTEDGLPQNMVTSAVQTHDGYLWFGTYSGLARFDGERFQVFDSINTPGLRDRRIASLFEDAHGTLWIGHEAGIVTRSHDGRFESLPLSSGTTGDQVIGIGSDQQGRLWAMHHNGSVDSLGDGRDRLPSLIAPALPGVMAWTRSDGGDIWLAENGQAARLENGRLAPIALPAPRDENYVLGVAAAAAGGVWVLCDHRVRKWQDGRWTEDRGEFPWPEGPLACSLELRDGTLAVGTIYSGMYLIFQDGRPAVHFDRTNGLPQNWVRFLYEDREGNLWLGAGSAGLVSIHTTAFSVLNSPDQSQGCTVIAVAPGRNGALWIGTDGAGLYRYFDGKWSHFGADEGLANLYIPAVVESPAGEVWAGPFWWGGPYRLEKERFIRPPGVAERSPPVFALVAPPGTDRLLVGNRDGLLQLQGGDPKWLVKAPNDAAGAVCAVVCDRGGAIWCGFNEGGLARVADGEITTFHGSDGLASEAVQCLLSDEDGSLWIGTADNGLTRFKDGRFASLGMAQGLADNVVCHLLDDGRGYLWLSTHHGIQRVAKEELNRCADGVIPAVSSQIYDQSDGLPTIEFTGGLQAAGCRTQDGRLLFASSRGVVVVDPAKIQPNPTPPPVVIESLLVDGRDTPSPAGAMAARLRPDHQRLEFRYSGLSFVAPNKVLFRYRLDGIDKDWSAADTGRTAYYSRLPAGSYRFRVIACNNDGLWNTTGASLVFTVAPFFWQTWWFLGACTLAAFSAVAWLARQMTQRRIRRRLDQLERQHAVERERSRIAQDIHDDLGASLTRIAMLSQPTPDQLGKPLQTATVLSQIYATARDVTRALDEIVWAVDPRHDTLDSLAGYMGNYAQDLLGSARIRCRLDFPVDLPAWPITAEVRHNLFLAFKEALNNTVRHAAATEVRISLSLRPDAFVLAVTDNGRGLGERPSGLNEPGRIAAGHGLPNLERRLARIGGHCEISSGAREGTSVAFIVNVPGTPTAPARPPSSRHHDAGSRSVP
jgi:ligand-binding sensor domain-containing protein/signal transduction histidine kinase